MLEHAATKIKTKNGNLLSKDFSPHGGEVKSLILVSGFTSDLCKSLLQAYLNLAHLGYILALCKVEILPVVPFSILVST